MRALRLLALLLIATSAMAADINIKWDANKETDLAGYIVHRSIGDAPFVPVTKTTATTYTFSNVSSGTYRVAVTAYNTSGIESAFSNIVSYSVPLAPSSLQLIVNQLIIK